jgi:hypothetical protein
MRALMLRRVGMIEKGTGGPVIVGRAENGDVLRLKRFLLGNGHPYEWLNPETDPEANALIERRRREGCLTRSEAARLLWAAWRAKQVMRDNVTQREVGKHIARFVLIGLYTGTRHAAICAAATVPAIGRSYVDLEKGIFYRLAKGKKATKKRQPPVRLPPKLLDRLRRWQRVGASRHAVVEWNGKPINSVRKGFASAVRAAGLDPWMMQNRTDPARAAEYLGMSEATLMANYFHLHPDYQAEAVDAFSRKRRQA